MAGPPPVGVKEVVEIPKPLYLQILRLLEEREAWEQAHYVTRTAHEDTRRMLDPFRKCGREVGVY